MNEPPDETSRAGPEASDAEGSLHDRIAALEIELAALRRERAPWAPVESALRLREAHYAAFYDRAPFAASVSTMRDGIIRSVNPAFERLFGYTAEELVGRTSVESGFGDPETRDRIAAEFASTGMVRGFETTRTTKSGERLRVSLHLDEMCVDGQQLILTTIADVTDQRRAEADRERLRREIADAQKMEAISTLAGGVAHDFNNILGGILGGLFVLDLEYALNSEARADIREMKALVSRGAELAKQLLGFARLGQYDVRPLSLSEVIEKTRASFGRVRADVVVEIDITLNLRPVLMDHLQLEQVLMNLFLNAGAAMPDGGRILVRAENTARPSTTGVGHSSGDTTRRHGVRLVVADTGHGMDEATRVRVFEPFFTTRPAGGGTGLGLASVYGIVMHHGGAIDVDSEVGIGSTFTLMLPAAEPEAASVRPSSMPQIGRNRSTVLVVDDEKQMLRICRRILENAGFEVLAAECGEDAIELVRHYGSSIVLVVLDMTMPGLGGASTFDTIHALRPELKVLLASGFGSEGAAKDILARGCNGFIPKPFTAQQLTEKVRSLL